MRDLILKPQTKLSGIQESYNKVILENGHIRIIHWGCFCPAIVELKGGKRSHSQPNLK